MVQKWIHLTELGGDKWVIPIWNSVNTAKERGEGASISKDQRELGIHISTRLNFLPRIYKRITRELTAFKNFVDQHKPYHVSTNEYEGTALDIDNDLKYQLLIDIDSLLFELNSVCDLMKDFFQEFHAIAGKHVPGKNVGLALKSLLDQAEQDSSWFISLDEHRNFFIHNGSPYIAVELSESGEFVDLLIMKENLKSFQDSSKYLRWSDIKRMVLGFDAAKPIIQKYLVGLFQK